VFQNVQFRGFDLDAVMLPGDPSLWLIRDYPCVIRKAVTALQDRDDKAGDFLLFYLTDRLRGIDSGHPIGLLNRNDFVTYGGEELAALAESVIRRAQHDCADPPTDLARVDRGDAVGGNPQLGPDAQQPRAW
jgi:hypothetical protein